MLLIIMFSTLLFLSLLLQARLIASTSCPASCICQYQQMTCSSSRLEDIFKNFTLKGNTLFLKLDNATFINNLTFNGVENNDTVRSIKGNPLSDYNGSGVEAKNQSSSIIVKIYVQND